MASISNLWKFYTFFGGKHHLIEQRLHERYGNIIRNGPNSLNFSSLASFEAIYGFNKSFEKGNFYVFGRDVQAQKEMGNIFSARTDAIHRERKRKVVGSAFTTTKVVRYETVISKNVSVLLGRLIELKCSAQDESTINIAETLNRFTFDTLTEIVYGDSMCPQPYSDLPQADGVMKAFKELGKFAWGGSLLPWFGKLMSTPFIVSLIRRPTLDSAGNFTGIAALAAKSREIIMTRPEKALESSQGSILKNFLEVPEDDSKHMPPDQIFRECFNLMVAGPGSTAAGLISVLYQLAVEDGHQWQDSIRSDVNEDGSIPTSSPILTAVIKETLRLYAPFPTAFPRVITAGAESAIPGISAPLPLGTTVEANSYILGHSKEIWGGDAEIWKPQRWLGTSIERKELEDKFVVFSKGARSCIGKEIAWLEIAKATIAVLQEWKIDAKEGALKGDNFLEMQYKECRISLSKR
ncbi:MAG: hypothetical protein MMC33_008920 [Icmadophila ericetorum]|nr:hypothetical protein [Icmadophila ericetorum]